MTSKDMFRQSMLKLVDLLLWGQTEPNNRVELTIEQLSWLFDSKEYSQIEHKPIATPRNAENGINTQSTSKIALKAFFDSIMDLIKLYRDGKKDGNEKITLTIGELKMLFDEHSERQNHEQEIN